MERVFVHENGNLKVWEIDRLACFRCIQGWKDGTLTSPKNGGPVCTHGRGRWQVGTLGPRGGWRGMSQMYSSKAAAIFVCDALITAALMPPDGA